MLHMVVNIDVNIANIVTAVKNIVMVSAINAGDVTAGDVNIRYPIKDTMV